MLAPLAAAMLTAIATLLAFAAPPLHPSTTLAAAAATVVASANLLAPPRVAIYLQISHELVQFCVEPPYFFRCFSFPLKAKLSNGC